jgi:hypothetical protein
MRLCEALERAVQARKKRTKKEEEAVSESSRRVPKKAIIAAVGATIGALAFWRKRRSKTDQALQA